MYHDYFFSINYLLITTRSERSNLFAQKKDDGEVLTKKRSETKIVSVEMKNYISIMIKNLPVSAHY